jgi:hypothetical protein
MPRFCHARVCCTGQMQPYVGSGGGCTTARGIGLPPKVSRVDCQPLDSPDPGGTPHPRALFSLHLPWAISVGQPETLVLRRKYIPRAESLPALMPPRFGRPESVCVSAPLSAGAPADRDRVGPTARAEPLPGVGSRLPLSLPPTPRPVACTSSGSGAPSSLSPLCSSVARGHLMLTQLIQSFALRAMCMPIH